MLNFVAKHFRKAVGVILWINLVFCTFGAAAFLSESAHGDAAIGLGLMGLVLGLVAGLITNILFGGLIVVFLNIDKGVKNINKWLQCMWQHSNNINKDAKAGFISDDDIYYFEGYMRPSSHSDSKVNLG